MDFVAQIERFRPANEQEESDKRLILAFVERYSDALLRDNELGHITSSGFVVNAGFDRTLMVFHNILGNWAWTGGHADGESDLLTVAMREAREETGVCTLQPLRPQIASLDILNVPGHYKKGKYVSSHLHLSVAFLLLGDESEGLFIKPDENSGVRWVAFSEFTKDHFADDDVYLYGKLSRRAQAWGLGR